MYNIGRESGGSYFAQRMVFFGKSDRRQVKVYSEQQVQAITQGNPPSEPIPALLESHAERAARTRERIEKRWADFRANRADKTLGAET